MSIKPYIATSQGEVLIRRVPRIPRRPPLANTDTIFPRRLPPNPPQFSGVVNVGDPGAPATRAVQLRLRDGTVLETARSDANGAFAMRGWYPVRDDYELHVIGEGYVSRSFPALAPAAVQWNGNPLVNPSNIINAPSAPPEDMFFNVQDFPPARINIPYSGSLQVTNNVGATGYTLTGALATGLSFPSGTAPTVSGTPTVFGTFPVTMEATDSLGRVATRSTDLLVREFMDWNVTWTKVSTLIFTCIEWSPANGGYHLAQTTTSNKLYKSVDGCATWVEMDTPGSGAGAWTNQLAYSPALGGFAVANMGFLSDAGVWTSATSGGGSGHPAWSPTLNLFMAVRRNRFSAYTSPDALVWTQHAIPTEDGDPGTFGGDLTNIVWAAGLGKFVATGRDGPGYMNTVMYDGTTFTIHASGIGVDPEALIWDAAGSQLVMVGQTGATISGGGILTSPNGINWTVRFSGAAVFGVARATAIGRLVAGHVNLTRTSTAGAAWDVTTTPAPINSESWREMCYAPETEVLVVATSGGIYKANFT